ncbi:glycoside hydrolase family 20 protein [Niabella terrae]
MFKRIRIFIALTLCMSGAAIQAQELPIIPAPVSLQRTEGQFTINQQTRLNYDQGNAALQAVAGYLSDYLGKISGLHLNTGTGQQNAIVLELTALPEIGKEGYLLDISARGVRIRASQKAGIFYGIQSLLQLLPAMRTNQDLTLPAVSIKDYPRFGWRGLHLDVSRHFFGPDFIKKYIDLLATYKLNSFHWHLSDDQGWRIEIKKYPRLTDVAAWRVDQNHLPWSSRPQAKPGQLATYGGYYTQQQIRDIVQYAADRSVNIVPEIDMPGHSAAAIAAYPNLSCSQVPQLPMTGGDYHHMSSNFCIGNDSVFLFAENVLKELMELFPSRYIHIGGDEVDKTSWKNCPRCQARMKALGLRNEEELQSYFIRRMEKIIVARGRTMIGWDEILEGGLAPEATVMSWRGERGGIEAAKMNHDVVMTPGSPLYFDHYQAGPQGEPLAFGGMNTLAAVYQYDPIPAELPADKRRYILGAQANLWAEHITSGLHAEYMILPRMLALAELDWTPPARKNWDDFNARVQQHFKRFDQQGLNYSKGNFTVRIQPGFQDGRLTATLSSEIPGTIIHYTTDGREPDLQSAIYNGPIPIDSSMLLKASIEQYGVIKGNEAARQNFVKHQAIGAELHYIHPVSNYYKAEGPSTLVNGIRGSMAINRFWHGFSAKDFEAVIDLGRETVLHEISLGCLQKYKDWIFLPGQVQFSISLDSLNFKQLPVVENPVDIHTPEQIFDFTSKLEKGTRARYIRVHATHTICPPGHSGAGQPGWIFADEFMVR